MSGRPEFVRIGPVHFQPLEWELEPVSRYLRGHLLNAGCGNRDISSYLRKAGIEHLTNYDIASTITGAVLGPLESMPFANAQFDSVLCNAVLEHVASAEAVVRGLVAVFVPVGEGAGLKAVAVHPVHSAAQTLGWIAWEIALERKSRLLRWVLWPVIYLATWIWIRTDPGILRNANTYQIVFTRS